MGTKTPGVRAADLVNCGYHVLQKGEYAKDPRTGYWYACTPNGHVGGLRFHDVTEHPDGTITVAPSILVTWEVDGHEKELWHGYLREGTWEEC